MSTVPPPADRSAHIRRLAARLLETEAELRALAAGEIDAILDPNSGAPMLLRDAQESLRQAELRARELIARLPIIACELAPDGTTRFINDSVTTILGFSPAELIGRPWWALVSKAFGDGNLARLQQEEIADYEQRVRAKDGSERIVLWTSTHLRDASGNLRSILLFGVDETERRRAEEARRELIREQTARAEAEKAERRSALLAEAGRLLGSALRYEATLTSIARLAVTEIAEYCIVDVVENDDLRRIDVAHPDLETPDQLREHLAEQTPEGLNIVPHVIRTGVSYVALSMPESIASTVAGPELARSFVGRSLVCAPLSARGHVIGALTVLSARGAQPYQQQEVSLIEELARRAALAVDNARLYEAALAASEAKSNFLAVMSHELRTPLNAVLGYADLMLLGIPLPLPEPSVKQVQRVRWAATHLLQMIDEILTVSRIEAGEEYVDTERADVCEVLRDTAALIEPLAEAKRLEFRCDIPQGPHEVELDVRKLRQIVLNLLGNAVKFTNDGHVRLSASFERDEVVIAVEDSGIGIAPENIERVFDPFWQVEQGHARRQEGTGLGLHVGRRLARLMNGDVRVTSVQGEGTRFELRLPKRYVKPVRR
jgi:PAS domain S-box-containing protein